MTGGNSKSPKTQHDTEESVRSGGYGFQKSLSMEWKGEIRADFRCLTVTQNFFREARKKTNLEPSAKRNGQGNEGPLLIGESYLQGSVMRSQSIPQGSWPRTLYFRATAPMLLDYTNAV